MAPSPCWSVQVWRRHACNQSGAYGICNLFRLSKFNPCGASDPPHSLLKFHHILLPLFIIVVGIETITAQAHFALFFRFTPSAAIAVVLAFHRFHFIYSVLIDRMILSQTTWSSTPQFAGDTEILSACSSSIGMQSMIGIQRINHIGLSDHVRHPWPTVPNPECCSSPGSCLTYPATTTIPFLRRCLYQRDGLAYVEGSWRYLRLRTEASLQSSVHRRNTFHEFENSPPSLSGSVEDFHRLLQAKKGSWRYQALRQIQPFKPPHGLLPVMGQLRGQFPRSTPCVSSMPSMTANSGS